MNASPESNLPNHIAPFPRFQEKRPSQVFHLLQPGECRGFSSVKTCLVTLVLAVGLCCVWGEPTPATPDPQPTPGNSPAQPPAKNLSNIEWLDDAVIRKARQAVVAIQSSDAAKTSTSGFFVSADGLVVTSACSLEENHHVVIRTSNNEEINGARLMAIDPMTDLAVLATGRKKQAYLQVHSRPVAVGEPCAVIFHANDGIFKTADGVLLAQREDLDWTDARLLEMWSVAVSPNMNGLTGGPVITRDGRVAGMCDLVGSAGQRFDYAIPAAAIAAVLAHARAARKPLEFPKPGEISGIGGGLAVEGDPDYMEAMKLSSAGNRAAALEKYRAVLKRHPQNPLVMNKVAFCLVSTGDQGKAREILEDAIRLAPERLGLRLLLGEILEDQGDHVTMIRHYQELTTRFPKFGYGWGMLGKSMFQTGRKAEGLAAIRKWTELEPDSMKAWDVYAHALTATGNHDEADRATERSSELESLLFKLRYSAPKRD